MSDQLASLLNLRAQCSRDPMGQLSREVALLMMHIGWTEDQVMSLPRYRRKSYVRQLCDLYGGYDEAVEAVSAEKTTEQREVVEFIEWYEGYVTADSPETLM